MLPDVQQAAVKEQSTQQAISAFAERVVSLRKKSGLTQAQASRAAGIDLKRWQLIEYGTVNATIQTAVRISAALGVHWTDVFAGLGKDQQ